MIDLVSGAARFIADPASSASTVMPGTQAPVTGGQAGGASFADVMQSMGAEVVGNLRTAEVQSFKAIAGEASTREVVDALMAAEQSLQTAIAVRDKLVTAYLEITRMQI